MLSRQSTSCWLVIIIAVVLAGGCTSDSLKAPSGAGADGASVDDGGQDGGDTAPDAEPSDAELDADSGDASEVGDADAQHDADSNTSDADACTPIETGSPEPAEPFLLDKDLIFASQTQAVDSTMWVGKAAWSDKAAVKAEIQQRISDGKAPYIFFYHWGDGPGRRMSDVENATAQEIAEWEAFAEAIAEGIGQGYAHVVLEPEWDANPAGANSSTFKDPLRRIITEFRQTAPNAVLVNGPGLWKSDGVYEDFADVASLMDLQGFLLHIVSSDPDCTWREDGTSFNGGIDFNEALTIVDKVRARAQRVQRLFGGGRVILTDLGVTRCDWGESGQEQIFKELIDALPTLYDDEGLRGIALRDGGPAPDKRFLGHNNEGMFGWTGHPAEAEIARAVTVLQSHMQALEQDSAGDGGDVCATGEVYAPEVRIGDNVNDYWVEVLVDDGQVDAVDVLLEGAPPETLDETDWGSYAKSFSAPSGTPMRVVARRTSDGASAGSDIFSFQQDSPVMRPGWPASFQLGSNNSTTSIEVTVPNASAVEVSVDGAGFTGLSDGSGDTFSGTISAANGSKVVLRAERADGAVAYSPIYDWPSP